MEDWRRDVTQSPEEIKTFFDKGLKNILWTRVEEHPLIRVESTSFRLGIEEHSFD